MIPRSFRDCQSMMLPYRLIVPLALLLFAPSGHSLADLDRALRESPRLGEDSEAFERDVFAIRQSFGELDAPWES
jgi:hypothetical protein